MNHRDEARTDYLSQTLYEEGFKEKKCLLHVYLSAASQRCSQCLWNSTLIRGMYGGRSVDLNIFPITGKLMRLNISAETVIGGKMESDSLSRFVFV